MCRSIRTLRPPYAEQVTEDDVTAAALQYVRKVAGMRAPSAANAEVFDAAVRDVAESTRALLAGLQLRRPAARTAEHPAVQPSDGQPAGAEVPAGSASSSGGPS